jgi:hypothetical protein
LLFSLCDCRRHFSLACSQCLHRLPPSFSVLLIMTRALAGVVVVDKLLEDCPSDA